eukprot:4887465-Pyramimonas_sp.AAC.1
MASKCWAFCSAPSMPSDPPGSSHISSHSCFVKFAVITVQKSLLRGSYLPPARDSASTRCSVRCRCARRRCRWRVFVMSCSFSSLSRISMIGCLPVACGLPSGSVSSWDL